jgi:soluble lytic murein transglycosylase-like protein
MVRYSIAMSCLLLAGWTQPAGNFSAAEPPETSTAISVVTKSAAPAEVRFGPAETTGQLTDLDEPMVASLEAPITNDDTEKQETPAVSADPDFATAGDALTSLDAVADGFALAEVEQIPLPPRRAVPHSEVCEALASAAANNDLPTPFLIRLIWQESGFNQNAVSPVGAQGVAQFMPQTAAEHGLLDPFNPLQAVRASARFLRDLVEQFGNIGYAAAAYNAGPGRVQAWLNKKANLPTETRNYVERITGLKPEQWKGRTAAAQVKVPLRAPCQREAGLYAADGPDHIPLPPSQNKPEPIVAKVTKNAPTKTASAAKPAAKTTGAKAITKTVSAKAASKSDKKPLAKPAETAPHKVAQASAKASATKPHSKKAKYADADGES